jgi:predicted oxidoreductase (fatty acid repression mutant protein)
MRHARRAIAILTGFATGFIAAATAAYATVVAPGDSAVVPVDPHEMPGFYNQFPSVTPSTSAAGLPLWQLLAFVALGVLMAVAIVGLGYSLSRSRRSQSSSRSQTALRS